MSQQQSLGTIGWIDITVEDAGPLQEFYAKVAGWEMKAHPMGDYEDYVMSTADGTAVAGICHKRGGNKDTPSQWLLYITVADLDAAVEKAKAAGGEVLDGPRKVGEQGRFCALKDPSGAAFALYQST